MGKLVKGRALLVITESLQKAMAVCFQPYPDPVIRDALIIICLLRLENRGQKFTLLLFTISRCSYKLLDYRGDAVTTEVRFSRDTTGFRTYPA